MMPSVPSLSFGSPLAKLVVLFFLAHPGSAATFSNTQDFLLSRYPNRDVLPTSLVPREERGHRPRFQAKPHYTPSSPYLFVKVPVPTLAPLDLSAPASANQADPESSCVRGLRPLGAGYPSGCPSPSRRKSGVRQVVVGDFISSLESKADMRGGLSQEEAAVYYGVNLPTASAAGGVGMLTVSSPEDALYSSQRQVSSKEAHNRVWSVVDGVWRFSASSVVGAYDNVVGFMESKLNNRAATVLKTPSFKFPSIGVGSMRQDLVGFMDLDPFERSRRFHKKRGKFL